MKRFFKDTALIIASVSCAALFSYAAHKRLIGAIREEARACASQNRQLCEAIAESGKMTDCAARFSFLAFKSLMNRRSPGEVKSALEAYGQLLNERREKGI